MNSEEVSWKRTILTNLCFKLRKFLQPFESVYLLHFWFWFLLKWFFGDSFQPSLSKKSECSAFGLFQLSAPCGAWSPAAHGEVAAQWSLLRKCMGALYFTFAKQILHDGNSHHFTRASNISFFQKFFNIPPWQIPNPCYNNRVLTTQPHIWGSSRVAKGDRL